MCRNQTNESGRRCPCDTSAARQARRQNAKARGEYSSFTVKRVEPQLLEAALPEEAPFSAETIRQEVEEFQTFMAGLGGGRGWNDEGNQECDRRLNSLGAGVERLAEIEFGAPTDDKMKDAYDAFDKNKAKRIAESVAAYEGAKLATGIALNKLQSTGINNESHPSISARELAWQEAHPEDYAAWRAAKAETSSAWEKLHEIRNQRIEYDSEPAQLLRKRNEAIKEALQEVGVEFAENGDLTISSDSHKKAASAVQEAITYYPKAWVEDSNANNKRNRGELRIKDSKGRAHYSGGKYQKKYVHTPRIYLYDKPEDWVPDPKSREDSEFVPTDSNNVYTEPKTGSTHEWTNVAPGKKMWARKRYDYAKNYKGDYIKPTRGRWQAIEVYEEVFNHDTLKTERTGNLITVYRREQVRRTLSEATVKAEITINSDPRSLHVSKNIGLRVALHEFAHRVEDSNDDVKFYENAFLNRRSGKYTDEPESLSNIYEGNKTENGYKDNFPAHYMGKVYTDGSRELLSMGMETLFTGSQGGFVGADNNLPDADYKRFILGVLATGSKRS